MRQTDECDTLNDDMDALILFLKNLGHVKCLDVEPEIIEYNIDFNKLKTEYERMGKIYTEFRARHGFTENLETAHTVSWGKEYSCIPRDRRGVLILSGWIEQIVKGEKIAPTAPIRKPC